MLGQTFLAWALAQQVEGYEFHQVSEGHVQLEGDSYQGEINLHDLPDSTNPVVELRITRRADAEDVFFLHFLLDDLTRAQELFHEMADALRELNDDRKTQVLLTCTCGITTTMFASKMNEVAQALGLPYQVQARPIDWLAEKEKSFGAVMLAPQVANSRRRVAEIYPDAAVFEIPARIFGRCDAVGALRMLNNALDGHAQPLKAHKHAKSIAPKTQYPGRFMVIAGVLGSNQSNFSYRVVDNGETLLTGGNSKRSFDFRDVEDLLSEVRLRGVDVCGLDAIGIAIPGIIGKDKVSLFIKDVHDLDLGGNIRKTYDVPVFLDNDANAAAVGCWATQHSYNSVTYHRENFGHAGGGQGMVINGKLHTGRKNFAGELYHLINVLRLSGNPNDLAWTEAGMYELVSRWVLINTVQHAPEAIYIDAWPVTDMARLRTELTQFVDDKYLPKLIPAPDFTEAMLLGELVLCSQRLYE